MANGSLNYAPARRYEFKVEDVEYRRDGEQSWLAMIYQPQGAGPFPALLDIHGGGWNNGDPTNNPGGGVGGAGTGAGVVSAGRRGGGEFTAPPRLAQQPYAI